MTPTETAPAPGLAAVDRLLEQAFDALAAVAASGSDAELVGVVARCEAAARRLDQVSVAAVAGLERRGVFADRGYKSPAAAVMDLLLCRVHHRQVHSTDRVVRIRDGLPEFVPPRWVDPSQAPRRKALPHLLGMVA